MPQDVNALSALLTDFATKLKSIEEKNSLLKERILLLDKTFLSENKRIDNELTKTKSTLNEIKQDTDQIKTSLRHMIKESLGFARKEELQLLAKKIKVWEPLKALNR